MNTSTLLNRLRLIKKTFCKLSVLVPLGFVLVSILHSVFWYQQGKKRMLMDMCALQLCNLKQRHTSCFLIEHTDSEWSRLTPVRLTDLQCGIYYIDSLVSREHVVDYDNNPFLKLTYNAFGTHGAVEKDLKTRFRIVVQVPYDSSLEVTRGDAIEVMNSGPRVIYKLRARPDLMDYFVNSVLYE